MTDTLERVRAEKKLLTRVSIYHCYSCHQSNVYVRWNEWYLVSRLATKYSSGWTETEQLVLFWEMTNVAQRDYFYSPQNTPVEREDKKIIP